MIYSYVVGQHRRGVVKNMGGAVSFNKRRVDVDVGAKGRDRCSCSRAEEDVRQIQRWLTTTPTREKVQGRARVNDPAPAQNPRVSIEASRRWPSIQTRVADADAGLPARRAIAAGTCTDKRLRKEVESAGGMFSAPSF